MVYCLYIIKKLLFIINLKIIYLVILFFNLLVIKGFYKVKFFSKLFLKN